MFVEFLNTPQMTATTSFQKASGTKKKKKNSQQNLFLTIKMLLNVSNKDVGLILSKCHWFVSRRIRNHLQPEWGVVSILIL